VTYEPIATHNFNHGREYAFDNGYGASVIQQPHHTDLHKDLYEVAVLDRNGAIAYDTPITKGASGGVLPFRTSDQVESILDQIAALPTA
jgi:hypothetical protein